MEESCIDESRMRAGREVGEAGRALEQGWKKVGRGLEEGLKRARKGSQKGFNRAARGVEKGQKKDRKRVTKKLKKRSEEGRTEQEDGWKGAAWMRAGTEVGEAGRALEQCWKKVGEGWKRVTRRLEKGHKKA